MGLFGPGEDEHYRPWGDRSTYVRTPQNFDSLRTSEYFRPGPITSLMDGLTVEAVAEASVDLLLRQ